MDMAPLYGIPLCVRKKYTNNCSDIYDTKKTGVMIKVFYDDYFNLLINQNIETNTYISVTIKTAMYIYCTKKKCTRIKNNKQGTITILTTTICQIRFFLFLQATPLGYHPLFLMAIP